MNRPANVTVAKLSIYFGGQPDGVFLSWSKIEEDTGIKMDTAGRSMARRGIRMARREYITARGQGVELSSPSTAMKIVGSRLEQVGSALRRTDRTHKNLTTRHLSEMRAPEQQKLLQLAGFLGAIRAMQREAEVKTIITEYAPEPQPLLPATDGCAATTNDNPARDR